MWHRADWKIVIDGSEAHIASIFRVSYMLSNQQGASFSLRTSSKLDIEEMCFSETSMNFNRTTRLHILQNKTVQGSQIQPGLY
jgi:hypothetical protein